MTTWNGLNKRSTKSIAHCLSHCLYLPGSSASLDDTCPLRNQVVMIVSHFNCLGADRPNSHQKPDNRWCLLPCNLLPRETIAAYTNNETFRALDCCVDKWWHLWHPFSSLICKHLWDDLVSNLSILVLQRVYQVAPRLMQVAVAIATTKDTLLRTAARSPERCAPKRHLVNISLQATQSPSKHQCGM